MRLTIKRTLWGVIGALFLMTPNFAFASDVEARAENTPTYNWAYAEEASRLLEEIHGLSARLIENSDFLGQQSRLNQLEWTSHALQLNQIRDHVNAMGENLQQLQEIHSMIAPWQQKAVERIVPDAVALAAHTEGAIEYLNEEQGKMWAPPYTDRLNSMTDHADEIKSSVSLFLDYGQTSGHLEGLERQIEFTEA